jgi:hypothetical protein
MMKRADMGDYPVAALLLLGRRGLGHWCQTPVPSAVGPWDRGLTPVSQAATAYAVSKYLSCILTCRLYHV